MCSVTALTVETGELPEPHLTLTTRILSSARRMNQMVGDLLDFTRGRLGSGIPITRGVADLGAVMRQAIGEMTVAHPHSVLQLTTVGDLCGLWDGARLSQLAANLLGNAVQHGAPGTLINVTAQGEGADVVLRVHNYGPMIPKADVPALFSPFKRFRSGAAVGRDSGNLGLGLYIADRIVSAHGGTMQVQSSAESGTLFTVRLPR